MKGKFLHVFHGFRKKSLASLYLAAAPATSRAIFCRLRLAVNKKRYLRLARNKRVPNVHRKGVIFVVPYSNVSAARVYPRDVA